MILLDSFRYTAPEGETAQETRTAAIHLAENLVGTSGDWYIVQIGEAIQMPKETIYHFAVVEDGKDGTHLN